MIDIEQGSGYEAITTSCFQLRFVWNSDHWKQEIVSLGNQASIPRIWSIEAGGDNTNPARVLSPTYQQIHLDRDPSGRARALLVGQSGPHHFSASFVVNEDETSSWILIDVADRCAATIEALAATYLIEASDAVIDHHSGLASLTSKNPTSCLTFQALSPAQMAMEEASQGSIRVQALAEIIPASKTQRLQYRWEWLNR